MTTDIFLPLLLLTGMGMAVFWDLKSRKIPNLITYPMMFIGLTVHGVANGLSGLGFSAGGLILGTCVFLIPYLLGGMGAGDAKLMGAAGAMLGATGVIIAAVISILIGFVYAVILLVIYPEYGRSFLQRAWMMLKTYLLTRQCIPIPPRKDEKQPTLCYALPIALGSICYVLFEATGSNLIQDLLGFQFSMSFL